MYGVDIARFQFQRMLTWAAVMLNADGTIYGRYGSRGERRGMRDNDKDISVAGFKKALEGALELHRGYPANKASLAGKTGPAPAAPTPERLAGAIPEEAVRAAPGTHGCVHCHNVQDWELMTAWKSPQLVPDRLLWPFPMPDLVGLSLAVDERADVARVAPGSPAEKAGFKPRDRILALDGQPILSIADVQWVLHQAPEPGQVKAQVKRGEVRVELTLPLAAGWRRGSDFANTQSLGWISRMYLAGFKSDALPAASKKHLGLDENALALRIDQITQDFVKHRNTSAAKIGLRKGDVIVEVDGSSAPMSEAEFLAYLAQKKKPGQNVELTYLRDGKRTKVTLDLP
jgi:membrane-associated protease RseP (regulator of RpoE activity)